MNENHLNEQYFFTPATINTLANLFSLYKNCCCLCAPMIGQELERRGQNVSTLDLDTRFSYLKGYLSYNIHRPFQIAEKFDVIVCDPPFFNVSLSRLFSAIRQLAHFDYEQPLIISYLVRRATNIIQTFSRFNIYPTTLYPEYVTVPNRDKNEIVFFSNIISLADNNYFRTFPGEKSPQEAVSHINKAPRQER